MSVLLSFLFFLHTAHFDRMPWQPKAKKREKIAKKKNPLKVILICCHGNQNVESSYIFCYQLHRLSDWEFVDVYSGLELSSENCGLGG